MNLVKKCLVGAVAAVLSLASAVSAADIRVQGQGASFPAPLYAKWVEAFGKAHPGVVVDYQVTGSGAGIKAITDRTVLFGATDAPMTETQEKALSAKAIHVPMVAGPEVLIYNLPGINNLKLNGAVIADIYLKNIRMWNDPKIVALNPGTKLPESPIVVVHRSDGSGTSYIFTDYLSKASADWKTKVGKGTSVAWPVGLGGQGNAGVAASVGNSEGGIGYVEMAYAKSAKPPLTYAAQINKEGAEVTASIAGVEASAASALKDFPEDLKVSITDAPGKDSYPICGFTYIVIYEDMSYLKDKATALAALQYLQWCVTDGQSMATELGYAKLPKEAQDKVLAKLKSVKFDGEFLLK